MGRSAEARSPALSARPSREAALAASSTALAAASFLWLSSAAALSFASCASKRKPCQLRVSTAHNIRDDPRTHPSIASSSNSVPCRAINPAIASLQSQERACAGSRYSIHLLLALLRLAQKGPSFPPGFLSLPLRLLGNGSLLLNKLPDFRSSFLHLRHLQGSFCLDDYLPLNVSCAELRKRLDQGSDARLGRAVVVMPQVWLVGLVHLLSGCLQLLSSLLLRLLLCLLVSLADVTGRCRQQLLI